MWIEIIKPTVCGKKPRSVGEIIDATKADGTYLVVAGKAIPAEEPAGVSEKPEIAEPVEKAEEAIKEETEKPVRKKKKSTRKKSVQP